jgi:UrcA family protein
MTSATVGLERSMRKSRRLIRTHISNPGISLISLPRCHHQEIAMKTTIKSCLQSTASVVATVVLVCAAITGTALADQPGEALTRSVTYGDLDLESGQGAKELYGRLRSAAQEVCSPLENTDPTHQKLWQNCVDSALVSAVSKINKPLVSALQHQNVNRDTKGRSPG